MRVKMELQWGQNINEITLLKAEMQEHAASCHEYAVMYQVWKLRGKLECL